MGILTDPSLTQRNKLGRGLVKHNRKICIFLYLAGAVWFFCLGHTNFNHATYLSENALSPGLVYTEIRSESARYAQTLLEELNRERETHQTGMPYSWLIAKMQQIGLETYTHNFTLNYPLGTGKVFTGKNVYGILRAPRLGSTEGVVYSAPYRAPDSIHADITASVPTLLAFADFARRQNYWAKDLIFLFTDQEQLGMYAWLEAYYRGGLDDNSILNAGNLKARAGSLQAALNLEIQDFDADYIDVKVEGLNGHLPNLDMFNLVQRLALRENIPCGYKQTSAKRRSGSKSSPDENVKNMIAMLLTQANGVPTGNHGLFHRYRVEALTLEAVKRISTNHQKRYSGAHAILKTIEGISRSLNNLLERFHQSYFFYIIVGNDRFVSIGDYTPSLILMAGPLFIKGFLLWLGLEEPENTESSAKENKSGNKINHIDMQYVKVAILLGLTHLLGLAAYFLPYNNLINTIFASNGISTQLFLTCLFVGISFIGLFMPLFVRLTANGRELLHIVTLLELGTVLIVVGLLNFSFGFILSAFIAPLAILLDTNHKHSLKNFSVLYTFLLHPLVVSYISVFGLTLISFRELALTEVAFRAISATMDAITFSVVDSMIYGNWVFNAVALAFLPTWILLWNTILISISEPSSKLKIN